MANSNSTITQRQISTSESTPIKQQDDEPNNTNSNPKFNIGFITPFNIAFISPFNIPSTLESAVLRALRNLISFLLFYVVFIWIVLFITLIPQRGFSLSLLLVNTNFAVMYLLILRAFPNSDLLHQWISKGLIFGALAIATAVEMIVSEAGLHLLFTFVGTIPVILTHAVLQATEGYAVTEEQLGGNDHIVETQDV